VSEGKPPPNQVKGRREKLVRNGSDEAGAVNVLNRYLNERDDFPYKKLQRGCLLLWGCLKTLQGEWPEDEGTGHIRRRADALSRDSSWPSKEPLKL